MHLVVLFGLAAAGAVGVAGAMVTLHSNWTNSFTYSHGYLVLFMSLWLLWRERDDLTQSIASPSPTAIVGLAGLCAAYVLADLLEITIGRLVLLPLVVLAAAAGVYGLRFGAKLMAPIGFLYFAIPIWDVLIGPLQRITTNVVSSVLTVTPVNAFIEGNYISTPHGAFEVAEGCSGVHFFIVGAAMAVFYGLAWCRRWRSRLLLLAVAIGAAMLANWIRVLVLVLVGEATGMQHYLIQEDHYVFGWALFGVIMLPVFWLARRLELADVTSAGREWPSPVVEKRSGAPVMVLAAAAVCALLLVAPAVVTPAPVAPPEQPHRLPLAAAIATPSLVWREVATDDGWAPDFRHPWAEHRGAYRKPHSVQVDIYAAWYRQQQSGSKLIYFGNRLDEGWQRVGSSEQSVSYGSVDRVVHEARLSTNDGGTRLIWEWYLVGDYAASKRSTAKLLELPALLSGRRDGAIVAVSALCTPDCAAARDAMRDLLGATGKDLERTVLGARRSFTKEGT